MQRYTAEALLLKLHFYWNWKAKQKQSKSKAKALFEIFSWNECPLHLTNCKPNHSQWHCHSVDWLIFNFVKLQWLQLQWMAWCWDGCVGCINTKKKRSNIHNVHYVINSKVKVPQMAVAPLYWGGLTLLRQTWTWTWTWTWKQNVTL